MSKEEVIYGNDEICRMLGWESNKAYIYQVPNLFPSDQDSGWIELSTDAIGFHEDWNMLIGGYNKALQLIEANSAVKELLKLDKNFVVQFGTKNFFGLFENQLHINSSWIKLVDFAKWYNNHSHIIPTIQNNVIPKPKPKTKAGK